MKILLTLYKHFNHDLSRMQEAVFYTHSKGKGNCVLEILFVQNDLT